MLRSFYTLAIVLAVAHFASAEQVFILLEGSCHSRVRYEKSVVGQPRTDYYAYHLNTPGGARIMLETGTEENTLQNFIPQGAIVCNDTRLNEQLVARVGVPANQVYILRPALNGQYYLNPVIAASAMRKEGSLLTYTSKSVSLQFDQTYGVIGENIAYEAPSANTVFEGRADGPCSGFYLFQQTDADPDAPYAMTNLRISPELGLMERRMGSDGVRATGGVIQARSVDGVPVLTHLATECEQLRRGASPVARTPSAPVTYIRPTVTDAAAGPVTYGTAAAPAAQTQPSAPTPSAVAGGVTGQHPVVNSKGATSSPGTHTVLKGETLYGISRKYGVTVETIRLRNSLTGNLIHPGQRLIIRASGAYAGTTTPAVANRATGAPAPPANLTLATPAPATYQTTPPTAAASRTHRVLSGETVASIALQNGYTEPRFRRINNLGPDDYLRVGQTVITDHCDCPSNRTSTSGSTGTPTPTGIYSADDGYRTTTTEPITLGATSGAAAASPPVPVTRSTTPSVTTAPTASPVYRAPDAQAPADRPAPGSTWSGTATSGAPRPSMYGAPARTMSQLEGRGGAVTAAGSGGTYGGKTPPRGPFHGTAIGVNGGAAASSTSEQPTTAAPRNIHIVQEGETLYLIARRYGTTTDNLRQINNLQPSEVPAPFQKLYLD